MIVVLLVGGCIPLAAFAWGIWYSARRPYP